MHIRGAIAAGMHPQLLMPVYPSRRCVHNHGSALQWPATRFIVRATELRCGSGSSRLFENMPEIQTCPNGHEFDLDETSESNGRRCPVCDTEIPARRGLWAMMGRSDAESVEDQAEEEPATESVPKGLWSLMKPAETDEPEADSEETKPAESTVAADGPKGLWGLMKGPTPETVPEEQTTEEESATESPTETASDEAEAPKGLWSLMGARKPADEVAEPDDSEAKTEAEPELLDAADAPDETAIPDDEQLEVAPLEELAAEEEREVAEAKEAAAAARPVEKPPAVRSGGAMKAMLLGLVALPMSALSLLPELWLRIPANLLGFLALMIGLLAVGEIKRSRGRQSGRRMAITGITCGVLSLMLGPFVFTQLGEHWRKSRGRSATRKNLERIGEGMTEYRLKFRRYPSGKEIRKHSWQTRLLPYLGEDAYAVSEKINLNADWNADENQAAMATELSVFYASGADRSKAGGFAVTHFEALAGTVTTKDGLFNVGVFDGDRQVSREDVTDGLEHTLVAGEVVFNLHPWGEPGRYRQLSKGIAAGRDTFGNADRSGALFLRADGSVKFLSKETSQEILLRLSTRDGGEK